MFGRKRRIEQWGTGPKIPEEWRDRGIIPSKGEWRIPVGLVNVGETLREAVVREAFEGTGLLVEPGELVDLPERIFRDDEGQERYYYLPADILCGVRGAELMAGSDAREAPWVGRDDLHKFGLAPVILKVIFKGLNVR